MTHSNIPTGTVWKIDSSDYAVTNCMNCSMGWARTGLDGGMRIHCLLDREPVLAGMSDCTRFELNKPTSATTGVEPLSDGAQAA